MLIAELLFALVMGLLIAAVFAYGLRRPGPWGGFLWLFLVVFLGAWAVGLWVEPVGPAVWGVAWFPIVFGALIIALIVAAIPEPGIRLRETPPPDEAEAAAAGVGLLFWLLIALLVVVIGFGDWV